MDRLRDLPQLRELSLTGMKLTDPLAKNLTASPKLEKLSLAGSLLTDIGARHLEALTGLTTLDLRKTRVTAEGIDALKKALPKCEIRWGGDAARPKGE